MIPLRTVLGLLCLALFLPACTPAPSDAERDAEQQQALEAAGIAATQPGDDADTAADPADPQPAADALRVDAPDPAERAAAAAELRARAAERMALMRRLLEQDNRPFLTREPELVAGKFRKMAHSPFLFLRGSAPLFWHDVTTPDAPGWLPSRLGEGHAGQVLITGDAHPENFGSYRTTDGTLLLDFNDFDTASYGPWHLELRRLALGWYVAGRMIEERANAPANLRMDLPEAAVEGYLAELRRQAAGEPPLRVREDENAGTVIADLLRRARRDGDIREELDDFTRMNAEGRREMFIGTHSEGEREGVHGSTLAAVDDRERERMQQVIDRWRHTLATDPGWPDSGYRVLGVSRRLGAGVGSYPIQRYYVLLGGPDEDPATDRLLDVKETIPPLRLPGVNLDEAPRWGSDAERVIRLMRAFQEFDDNDPMAGWANLGEQSFHVQDRVKYQKNLDVERMIDRRQRDRGNHFSDDDLREVARVTGHVLARGHARAPTLTGEAGGDAIRDAIANAGNGDAIRAEMRTFVSAYGPVFFQDFAHFRRLLEERGPLLGIE